MIQKNQLQYLKTSSQIQNYTFPKVLVHQVPLHSKKYKNWITQYTLLAPEKSNKGLTVKKQLSNTASQLRNTLVHTINT